MADIYELWERLQAANNRLTEQGYPQGGGNLVKDVEDAFIAFSTAMDAACLQNKNIDVRINRKEVNINTTDFTPEQLAYFKALWEKEAADAKAEFIPSEDTLKRKGFFTTPEQFLNAQQDVVTETSHPNKSVG